MLRERVDDWDTLARHLNIDPKARAEELSLLQWIGVVNFIAPLLCPDIGLTNNERFPIVDKNDRILRDASRSQVHGNNLRHRAVHILIFDPIGEVYLQQRSRWKDRHPLKWDSSAAGHVIATESYDDAAQRELKEELGISVPLKKIVRLSASERTDYEVVWLYRGEVAGNLQTAQSRSFEFSRGTLRLQFAAVDSIAKHLGHDFISAKEVDLKTMRLFLRARFCVNATNVSLRIRIRTSSHNES